MAMPLNAAGIYSLVSTLGSKTLGLGCHLINVTNHVEGNLREVIVLASEDILESSDGLVNGDKLARVVGEHLSNLEELED